MAILVVYVQDLENYGAHDWSGEGECPQYWKAKGGSTYKIKGIPQDSFYPAIVEAIKPKVEECSKYFKSYIVDWSVEDDGFMSDFEKSQLEFEGRIQHPEPVIQYSNILADISLDLALNPTIGA